MRVLILAQSDLKSGKGHINRSNLVFKYLKKKKVIVDHLFFCGDRKLQIYNKQKISLDKKNFNKKVEEANVIITDEVTCPKNLIKILKKKFICSISPNGRINKYARIIFSRTSPIGRYSKKTIISSDFKNFLPGSNIVKIKNYKYKINLKKKIIIGISMGGYDKQNKTLKLLKLFHNFKNLIKLKIIFNKQDLKNYNKVIHYIKTNKINSKIYTMKKNMWNTFSVCSFVFLSGGISAYESIFIGIPSINIINNFQKRKLTEYLASMKLTSIYKVTDLKNILNLTNLYLKNSKSLLKQKSKIDSFVGKVSYDPYKKLLKLILKYHKSIN